MAPKIRVLHFLISLGLLLVAAGLAPFPVAAASLPAVSALPDLRNFASSVQNGSGKVLRGAYASGLFAFPVLQQPSSNAGYVAASDDTLTQFGLAGQFGNVGLLAHDYLSGQYFSQLAVGQSIQLVYGDGRIEYFRVSRVYRYQAVSPLSVYSDFIDLDTRTSLSASDLFKQVYGGSRHLTFQTCITQNGNPSWGRLFVVAVPAASPARAALPN